jgi:DNA-binding CsgD family transcriptional regulator
MDSPSVLRGLAIQFERFLRSRDSESTQLDESFTIDCDVAGCNIAELILSPDTLIVVGYRSVACQTQSLTEREAAVARGIASGQSHKKIASTLGISIQAVSTYLRRVRGKRNVTNNMELALNIALGAAVCRLAKYPSARSCSFEYQGCRVFLLSVERGNEAGLSLSEEDVLVKLMKGHSLSEIAQERGTSPHTVAVQISHVLRKLEVPSRFALASHWLRHL